MDIKVRNKVAELQRTLEQDEQRISLSDPVAKMMLVAMSHQSCEIERKMDQTVARLSEQFCDQVLLRSNLQAQPAVSVVNIGNGREYAPYYIDENDTFTYKANQISSLCLLSGHVACNGVLLGCNSILFIKQATIRPGTIRDLNIGRKLHLVAL